MPRYGTLLSPVLPKTLQRWLIGFNRLAQVVIIADVFHCVFVICTFKEMKSYWIVALDKPLLRSVQTAQVPFSLVNTLYSIGLLLVIRRWEPTTTIRQMKARYIKYIIPSEAVTLLIWVVFSILQGLSTPHNANDFSFNFGWMIWAVWILCIIVALAMAWILLRTVQFYYLLCSPPNDWVDALQPQAELHDGPPPYRAANEEAASLIAGAATPKQ